MFFSPFILLPSDWYQESDSKPKGDVIGMPFDFKHVQGFQVLIQRYSHLGDLPICLTFLRTQATTNNKKAHTWVPVQGE